jgi:hypothetical protein
LRVRSTSRNLGHPSYMITLTNPDCRDLEARRGKTYWRAAVNLPTSRHTLHQSHKPGPANHIDLESFVILRLVLCCILATNQAYERLSFLVRRITHYGADFNSYPENLTTLNYRLLTSNSPLARKTGNTRWRQPRMGHSIRNGCCSFRLLSTEQYHRQWIP